MAKFGSYDQIDAFADADIIVVKDASTGTTVYGTMQQLGDYVDTDQGFVTGPASATDNAVVRFDLATGKLVQNSGVLIDDSNNMSGISTLTATSLAGSLTTASQTAVTGLGTITTGTWQATTVAVLYGGTGATTASGARTSLGLAIGTDVQAYDAGLQSISGLTTAADQMIYTTALDTYATASLTSFARSILDDADAATVRTTIGLGSVENTALSTWAGSVNITTLGTIATGTWQGTPIANAYVAGLDQDLLQASSPTFAGLTLTGKLELPNGLGSTIIQNSNAILNIGRMAAAGYLSFSYASEVHPSSPDTWISTTASTAGRSALEIGPDISLWVGSTQSTDVGSDVGLVKIFEANTAGVTITGTLSAGATTITGNATVTGKVLGTTANGYLDLYGDSGATSGVRIGDDGNTVFGGGDPWERVSIPYNQKLSFGSSSFPLSVYRQSTGSLYTYIDDHYNDNNTRILFRMRVDGTLVNVLTLAPQFVAINSTARIGSEKLRVNGGVNFSALPTADPTTAGELWNDSGTVKISAG